MVLEGNTGTVKASSLVVGCPVQRDAFRSSGTIDLVRITLAVSLIYVTAVKAVMSRSGYHKHKPSGPSQHPRP